MLTRVGKLAIADAGFDGLTLPHLAVFSAFSVAPNEQSVWADFTIAVYTGYASPVTAIGPVFLDTLRRVTVPVAEAVFLGPTAGAGMDVLGWVLYDGTTHAVWACDVFDGPKSLNNILDRLQLDVKLHLDGSDEIDVDN